MWWWCQQQAQELNVLVAGAFRTAYAHSQHQSPLSAGVARPHHDSPPPPATTSSSSLAAADDHLQRSARPDDQSSPVDHRRRPPRPAGDTERRQHQSRDQRDVIASTPASVRCRPLSRM